MARPIDFAGFFRGCYFAQLGLASLWIALGAEDWKMRWGIGLTALIHIWGAACTSCDWWQNRSAIETAAYTAAILLCLVMTAGRILRNTGPRLILRYATPGSLGARPFQVTIRALLCVTAAAAAYLCVFLQIRKQMWSLHEFEPLPHSLLLATAFNAVYGVWSLVISIASLRARRFWLVAPVILAAWPLVAAAVEYLLHTTDPFWIWAAGSETTLVLASIAVMRAAGYRLVSEAEATTEMEANRSRDSAVEAAAVDLKARESGTRAGAT